jgi:hypothetical protein
MNRSLRAAAGLLLWTAVCFPAAAAGQTQGLPSIRRVQVLRNAGQVEIEIEASDRLVPRANVLTGPDRLVLDFVNALPGAQLRTQAVNRGEVKSVRVGLFSANPPVTRLVVDLSGPQPYQVFPSGRTVIVKVGGSAGVAAAAPGPASGPVLVNTNYASHATLSSMPERVVAKPPLEVSFRNGLLAITSNKASLSEVLFAIHERTGAEIAIPSGAEQEQVVADIGPAPAPEVLSQLLNGSKFNFLILSSTIDPRALDRVILSSRPEGPMPPPPRQTVAEAEDEGEGQAKEAQPKESQTKAAAQPADETDQQRTGDPGHPQEPAKPAPGSADTPD